MAILSHSSLIICLTKTIHPLCSSQQDFLVETWISVSSLTYNKDLVPDQDSKQPSRLAKQSNLLMTLQESEWSEEKLPQSQQTNSRQFQPAPLYVLYHLNKFNALNQPTITSGFQTHERRKISSGWTIYFISGYTVSINSKRSEGKISTYLLAPL